MNDKIKPEDLLRRLRARTRGLQALLEENAGGDRTEGVKASLLPDSVEPVDIAPPDNLLQPDHLSLFLRSLSSRLTRAIDEIRASSDELEKLASEVQKNKNLLDRSN